MAFGYAFKVIKKSISLSCQHYLAALPLVLLSGLSASMSYNPLQTFISEGELHYTPIALAWLIQLFISASLLFFAYQKYHNNDIDFQMIFKKGISRLIPFIVTLFLSLSPILIGLIALFFSLKSDFSPFLHNIFSNFTGTILIFIFLSFFLVVYLYLSQIPVVCKNANPIAALKQSWDLTRSNWWKTTWLLLFTVFFTPLITKCLELFLSKFHSLLAVVVLAPLYAFIMIVHYDNLEIAKTKVGSV